MGIWNETGRQSQYAGPSNHCPLSQILIWTIENRSFDGTRKETETDNCDLKMYIFIII